MTSTPIPAGSNEWLTAAEAASYLKVKVRTLLRWVREGKIQAYGLSGTKRRAWRFLKRDLDTALLSRPVLQENRQPCSHLKGGVH